MTKCWTIDQAGRALRSGQISPRDLLDDCLEKIERYEGRVRAWVQVGAEGARREAERLGEMLRDGQDLGPLHGVPIGIKDIVDVAGFPTRAASPLRQGHVAREDAPVVARLRRAGAIILGKTVTTELAGFDPPPTRNSWNLAHTPGGSSSGSAAAVALGMCLAAIGSQTGGSIVRPASYCGVAGFKPTWGRVSTAGVVEISVHLDHVGPLARTAEDLAAVWEAIDEGPASSNEQTASRIDPPRLFVLDDYFHEQSSSAVWEVFSAALARIQPQGTPLPSPALPPSFAQVHAMHRRIMAVEAAEYHRRDYKQHPGAFGPHVSALIQEGLHVSAVDFAAALRHQRQFKEEILSLFADGRLAVMPSTNTTAPASLETTGDPRFNSPWSYAGLPEATIPCGLVEDGMPCGLQIVGPPHSDRRVLAAAAWCQRQIQFDQQPELLDA